MPEEPKWAPNFADSLDAARAATRKFAPMFRHGTLLLGLYAPEGSDPQEPHEQDEVYIVATGTAEFVREAERVNVGPGDALFVPARMGHRFENFSDDFTAWVVFYGPQGGEAPAD
jgi:mannose-6-phosphate isomerase-like protein (cupin superfamily)